MTFLRSLLFNTLIAASLLVAGLVFMPVLIVSRATARRIALAWIGWLIWLLRYATGLTVDVRGRENIQSGPAIYAAKHQSALETFQLPLLLPQADIVVKRELGWIPVAGWFLTTLGTVPIDRGAGARALKGMLSRARARVAQGRSIVIFPEGTRTAPRTQRPYQPGVAALYADLDLPVVPIALNTGLFWSRRGFAKRQGVAIIEFLPPIPPGLDRRAFMTELQNRIEQASAQLLPHTG